MERICRGCLTMEERDVTTQHQHFTEKDRSQFLYATGIQIKENEVSTFILCKDCQENMKTTCKFKKTSRNSYRLFQTYLAIKEEGCNMDFPTYIRNEESLYGFRFYNDAECNIRNKDDQTDNVSTNTNLLNFVTTMIKEERSMSPNDNTIQNRLPGPETMDDTMDTQWLQDENAMTPDFPINFSELNTPSSQMNQSLNGFASTPRHQTQHSDVVKIESQCVIDNNLLRAINNNKDMCNIEDILSTPRLDSFLPKPMLFSDKELEFSIGNNLNYSSKQMYIVPDDNYNEESPNPKENFRKPRKSAPWKNMDKMRRYIEDDDGREMNSDDNVSDTDDKLNVSKGSTDDEVVFKIPKESSNSKEIFRKPRKSAPRKNMDKMRRYIEDDDGHEMNSDDNVSDTDDKLNVSKRSTDDEVVFKIPKESSNSKEICRKPRKTAPRKNMDMFKRCIEDVKEHEMNSSDINIADTDDKLNITKGNTNDDNGVVKIPEVAVVFIPEENCRMKTEMYHHVPKDKFKCKECEFTVHCKKLFVRHCSDVHNIDVVVKVKYTKSKVSCETCGKIIVRTNMGYHMKSHEVDVKETKESATCEICKLKFQNKNKLKVHMSTHNIKVSNKEEQTKDSKIYKYACSKCSYRAKSSSNLNVHLRRHEKKFTYICHECGKGHIRKGDLDRHYRVHSGDKPFKCPHCSSSFRRLDHLNLHIRDHTGERPYLCDTCDEAFKQRGDLTYHKRYVCSR